jgi:ABC-type dipeptide/oligopeptide/nickel transport system permease subunit
MASTTTTGSLDALHDTLPGGRHPMVDATRRILRTPVGAVTAAVIAVLVLSAILAPVLATHSPRAISADNYAGPSVDHLLGTDPIGRDTFSRLLYGARTSLYVGFLTVFVGTLVGAIAGLISGFAGGWIDLVIQRIVDAIFAFPGILLAMAIVSVLGPSTTNSMLAIAVIVAANNSRVVRGAVLSIMQNTYIEAAIATGANPVRVAGRHVLPNVVAPLLILISSAFGAAILIEGGLSFLGLGTQPPNASWGVMLSEGRVVMEASPWLAIFSGLAIGITVLSFNLLGDVIRDVLDPRLRGSR